MNFDDDDEEMGILPEDDDDEDFFVPSMAQKEKKIKRSKAAGGGHGKASQASKCGRGRKQCPNCQIVVPTCRTQCTECSYQFVTHSSSPGDLAVDGPIEQNGPSVTTIAGSSEAPNKTKTVGVKKHLTKKRKKEGLAGKPGKKDANSHLDSPAAKTSKIHETEAMDGNVASGSDSEMASVEQASIAGSDDPRQSMESPAGDVETVQLERVGKGYKRCPRCSIVQGSSYAKCPKCDYAFTSKAGKGNPKKERGKPMPPVKAKPTNGIGRLSGSSFSKPGIDIMELNFYNHCNVAQW